jgi:hypothetical protein
MFSSGLLRNPSPAQGQSAPFQAKPGAGPSSGKGSGAPNFQEFLNPNLSNAARSGMGNGVVSYPFLTRPFRSGGGVPAEGEPVFTIRQSAKKAGAGFLITALPLTYLNTKLYEAAATRSAAGGPLTGNNLATALDRINSAEGDGTLSFLGVMRNEAIAPSRHQKLINVDIRGRSRIRNYWHRDIRGGTKLYLILKRTTVGDYTVYKPQGRKPSAGMPIAKVVPVTRNKLAEMMEDGSLGVDDEIIYIGYTMNTTHRGSSDDRTKRALVNTDRVAALDFIEIALAIGK